MPGTQKVIKSWQLLKSFLPEKKKNNTEHHCELSSEGNFAAGAKKGQHTLNIKGDIKHDHFFL